MSNDSNRRINKGQEIEVNPKDVFYVNSDSEFIYAGWMEYNLATKNTTSRKGIITPTV